ncbi:helix-turn-helix domain-containing protein [Amycolatopsis samaneae]|uniref:Helix-turn-helix domain-containing protein n=1 Tax=Amycolatopsis samaneae TaxID=664691 RepID=A0ABW5G8W6_9PSEU
MTTTRGIWRTEAVADAVVAGAPGPIVRALREANRLTLKRMAELCGYSISALSRMETGRQPLRDVDTLRRIVDVLGVPPALLGLAERRLGETPISTAVTRVGDSTAADKGDAMRRRAFLAAAGLTVAWPSQAGAAVTSPDPAAVLADRLGDVLLGPVTPGEPASPASLSTALRAAQQDFLACRYLVLAQRLPEVISAGEAIVRRHGGLAAHAILAQAYILASRVLTKLDASGLEWVAADRASHVADVAGDPLISAEAQRMVASSARRAGHHGRAQELTLAAAERLAIGAASPPAHLAMYGLLHCSAAYAAARAGDRERAADLLDDASATAERLASDPARYRALVANVVSHRVSTSYLLGDAGTALHHAASLPLSFVPTVERQARLLVDTALAAAQWDQPAHAYRVLLEAERRAPGEVHTRSTVRALVTNLMEARNQAAMPGLPRLAQRVHATRVS